MDLEHAAYERVVQRRPRAKAAGPPGRVVLVTGVGAFWGSRVARALEKDDSIDELLGMDMEAPQGRFSRMEFVHMGLRNPFVVDLLRTRKVETVVHTEFRSGTDKGREMMFETNVLGTRHILAACQDAGVARLIVRSSTMVYGPSHANPNFLDERAPARSRTKHPRVRDLTECEADFKEFASRSLPSPKLTVLRFAHVVGPSAPTSMNAYLRQPVLQSVLGFDPLLQFVHETDAVGAIVAAVGKGVTGAINVAAPGVLPLSRVAALLGKRTSAQILPWFPSLAGAAEYFPSSGKALMPSEYLMFLCNGETRRMTGELGFTPKHTARQAIELLGQDLSRPRSKSSGPEHGEYARRLLAEVLEPDDAEPTPRPRARR